MKYIKTFYNTKKLSNLHGVSIVNYSKIECFECYLVSGKKTGGRLDLRRKMHAPMGPNEAGQQLEFTQEFSSNSRGDQIQTIQIHTKTDSMPFADKFDVRER